MLRKTLLSLLMAACFAIELNAQTEKGTFSIGLNTGPGLSYSLNSGNKSLLLNGDLRAGYFLKNNLMIGGEFGLSHFKLTQGGEVYASSTGFNSGLFTRKYFDLKNPKWKPFIEVGVGLNHGEVSYLSSNNSQINYSRTIGYARAELGIAYFINKNTSLNLSYFQQANFGKDLFYKSGGLKFGVHFNFDAKRKK